MKDIKDKIIEAWITDRHQHIFNWQISKFLNERLRIGTQEDDNREYLMNLLIENLNSDNLGLYARFLPGFGLSYKAVAKEFEVDEATVKQLVRDKTILTKKYDYKNNSPVGKSTVYSINICYVQSIKTAYNAGKLLPPLEITEQTVADALYTIQCQVEDLEMHGCTDRDEKQRRDLSLLKHRALSQLLRTNNNIERLGLILDGEKYKRFFKLQGYIFYSIVKNAPDSEKENPLESDPAKDPLKPEASMELVPAKYLLQEFIDSRIAV